MKMLGIVLFGAIASVLYAFVQGPDVIKISLLVSQGLFGVFLGSWISGKPNG